MKKYAPLLKFILLFAILGTVIWVVKTTGLTSKFSIQDIRQLITNSGIYGELIFVGVYILVTVLFLPATPVSIAAGLLFGPFKAMALVIIGATIGATIAFLFARYFGRDFIQGFIKSKFKKLKEYDGKINENGLLIVILLRLMPLFPFNGLNLALGLTKVKLRDYIMGTVVGIIPGVFVLTFLGGSLDNLKSPKFIIAILLFIALFLFPIIYKSNQKKRSNH